MLRLFAFATILLAACQPGPLPKAKAQSWPAADRLFHAEPRWLGADSAYSIDLGSNRVLWLFGDSFIATSDAHVRSQSVMVRNSVAIQTGYDPTTATMEFFWATNQKPASFFPEAGAEWLWPGHGARIGDHLLIFFMKVKSDPGGLGFRSDGAQAVLIDNPDAAPPVWVIHPVTVPPNNFGVSTGAGGCMIKGDDLHCYSPVEPGNHDIYLLRFPLADAGKGDLSTVEWYTGAPGFVPQSKLTEKPRPLFTGGQTELSVHFDALTKQFIEIQVDGFGGANIAARKSLLLEGVWSNLQTVFRPLESNSPNTLVYSAKAHPELSGTATALTYCTNNTDFNALVNDMNIYYPRFVQLTLNAQ